MILLIQHFIIFIASRIRKKNIFEVENVSYTTQVCGLKYHISSNYRKEVDKHDPACMVLVFENKVLQDESTLGKCGVKEGSTVYLGILSAERYQYSFISDLDSNVSSRPEAGFAGSILVGTSGDKKGNNNNGGDDDDVSNFLK